MLKSILALFLSLSLLLTLAACGKEPEVPETDSTAEIVSQTQGEETDLISAEESPVESIAESVMESVTAKLPATTPSAVESKVSSVAEPQEETASQTTLVPSVTSQENEEQNVAPVDLFQGNTVEELLSWVRTNRVKSDKVLADKPILAAAKSQSTLLVPSSKRSDLTSYGIKVSEKAENYIYYFRTNEYTENYKNELYSVLIRPIEKTSGKWIDTLSVKETVKSRMKQGTYQGKSYYYVDGDEGTDSADSIFVTAWLLEGDYIIQITASWANSFKPWNPEWFDYFNFENVTL